MKKSISKMLLSLLLVCSFVMVAPPQTAKAYGGVGITNVKANSVTITWPAQSSTAYQRVIGYRVIYNNKVAWSGTTTYATLTGLSKGWEEYVQVEYIYINSLNEQRTSSIGATWANTTPATISSKNFGIGGAWSSSNKVWIKANLPKNATKVQYQLYSRTGKRLKSQTAYSMSDNWSIKKNTVYKYRVRAICNNTSNNKNYYGSWSGYKYFDFASLSGSSSSKRKGATIKLKKATGVKSYTIAVSTKQNSGYKNVKTVKVTSKKTYTTRITKYGKKSMSKKKWYYIRVTPNIKVGSKTKASDIRTVSSFYNYK